VCLASLVSGNQLERPRKEHDAQRRREGRGRLARAASGPRDASMADGNPFDLLGEADENAEPNIEQLAAAKAAAAGKVAKKEEPKGRGWA
jgi:Stm1